MNKMMQKNEDAIQMKIVELLEQNKRLIEFNQKLIAEIEAIKNIGTNNLTKQEQMQAIKNLCGTEQEKWKELYIEFDATAKVNSYAECKAHNERTNSTYSRFKYICNILEKTDILYMVAMKLYR